LHSVARHRLLLAALVLGAAGGLYFLVADVLVPEVDAYQVRQSDVVQTVVARGGVESPLRVSIGSQVTGTVSAIPVVEGQNVVAGQVLIELERSEAESGVTQAAAAVTQAQNRIRQLDEVGLPTARQNLRQAQVNLLNVQRQFDRIKQLRSDNFVGQAQLDDAQHNLDVAQSQVSSAQLQVTTNAASGSDYSMAVAALEQARASLKMAQARLGYTRITAPVAGTLIARNVERGDVAQPGKALMVLSPAGQTQLVLQIDEKSLAKLHLGQKALASADAYPDQRFTAELAYINPSVDPARGSVEVKLNLPQTPVYLRQDMTVSVDIEVDRRLGTLVAPALTVHDIGSAAPWVMKVSGGVVARQPVELGLRGSGQLEILAGLQAGDVVLPSTNLDIGAGHHVRVHIVHPERKAGA
jgi:HlyD family secretion protein